MKVLTVIPARYGSQRFPGKVLAMLGGKPIVQHVWDRALQTNSDDIAVAVDDQRVFDAVTAFGGKAVMTSPNHPSGSDRIWEVAKKSDAQIIVNIQGDEPFIEPHVVNELIEAMKKESAADIGTVVVPYPRRDFESNPNIVKAVLTKDHYALYFSRSMIPYCCGEDTATYRHWGLYAYKRASLERFVSLPEGTLEKCEKLEQLRALENGMKIRVIITEKSSIGIDTPEDLVKAEQYWKEHQR